jgi:hypothetical protein
MAVQPGDGKQIGSGGKGRHFTLLSLPTLTESDRLLITSVCRRTFGEDRADIDSSI